MSENIPALKWENYGPTCIRALSRPQHMEAKGIFVHDAHVYTYSETETEITVELEAPTADLGRELAELLVHTAKTFAKAKGY